MNLEAPKDKITIKERLKELEKWIIEPWKIQYVWESNDKKYKIYAYKAPLLWNKRWIKDKYIKQIWPRVEWTQITDVNWNEIKKNTFKAWEIVYLRVPKEYIDPTPEMKLEEIMNLKDEEVIKIVEKCELYREHEFKYSDKNWLYTIINGKKIYLCDNSHLPKRNWTYIRFNFQRTWILSLFTKEWNKYRWINWQEWTRAEERHIDRWTREYKNLDDIGVHVR